MVDPDKCSVTRYPAPVLAKAAKTVEEINDEIRRLADKMIDMMIETKGVGLAGPQAGVNLRIFVFSIDGTRESAKVYINPEIEVSGDFETVDEGCLSLPEVFAKVKRYKQCTITATDLEGSRFTEVAEGLQIRGFQHEHDHLEGMLIKDRMGPVALIGARKQLKKLREDYKDSQNQ